MSRRPSHAQAQRRAVLRAGVLALVLGLLLGCGDVYEREAPEMKAGSASRADAGVDASSAADAGSSADEPIVLVGEVDDSDIRLGVVLAADRMRLFFCGGPSSYASATLWVQAELAADSRFDVRNDALELQGELDDGRLYGELTRAGEPTLRFSAEPVRAGTLAGLYETEADCGRVGLIVAQPAKSDPPAAQGACVGPGHAPEQVNPILPLALDQDGTLAVEVAREDSVEPARVHAAAPPL